MTRGGSLALDRLHAGLAPRGMRHVLFGLLPLTLVVLLFPAGSGARTADPASPESWHRTTSAAAAHPAVSTTVHGMSSHPLIAHPGTTGSTHSVVTHPVPVHPATRPAHSGPMSANGVHPEPHGLHGSSLVHSGSSHGASAYPAPAKSGSAHPSVAQLPATGPVPAPAEPDKGSNTGLPLPRWSALRTEEVNLRTGPGTRYPIDWVYKRRDLPVRVEREFDVWRLVALPDGTKGWVSGATLVTHRTFSVVGSTAAPERVLRATASEEAAVVARLKPGVIGRIRTCEIGAAWCQVQIGEYRGWLRRDAFWGTDPGEAVQ